MLQNKTRLVRGRMSLSNEQQNLITEAALMTCW